MSPLEGCTTFSNLRTFRKHGDILATLAVHSAEHIGPVESGRRQGFGFPKLLFRVFGSLDEKRQPPLHQRFVALVTAASAAESDVDRFPSTSDKG